MMQAKFFSLSLSLCLKKLIRDMIKRRSKFMILSRRFFYMYILCQSHSHFYLPIKRVFIYFFIIIIIMSLWNNSICASLDNLSIDPTQSPKRLRFDVNVSLLKVYLKIFLYIYLYIEIEISYRLCVKIESEI